VDRIFCLQNPAATPADRLAELLHDAPEYVIGDMISPFKAVLDGAYKAIEARLLAAIHLRFGLPPTLPDALRKGIKKADQVAAYWEAVRLAGFSQSEAVRYFGRRGGEKIPGLDSFLTPWPALQAESGYLHCIRAVAAQTAEHSMDSRGREKRLKVDMKA
jgi:5'-deoxynucleotidase YfbR-like HD superfamily hydrolase